MKLYYKSEEWKEKRKLILQIHNYTCELCGAMGKFHIPIIGAILHIHHKTYENFQYEGIDDLMCVCDKCHKNIHNK